MERKASGNFLLDDLFDPLLVHRVQIRVQQTDRNRRDTGLAQLPGPGTDFVVVERNQDIAVGNGDAFLDRQPVAAIDKRGALPRQFLLHGKVERLLVPGDMQDVTEALRGDHAHLSTGMRQCDVRRNRRAVHQLIHLG